MKTIDYKNYEWIIIEEDEEKIKLLKKDAIENSCVNFDGIDDKLADFKEELGDIENIDILSVEDIVKMDLDIIICSQSYWTDSKVKNSSYVWAVDSTGYLTHWNSAYISLVVRPVITILKSKLYQNKKNK